MVMFNPIAEVTHASSAIDALLAGPEQLEETLRRRADYYADTLPAQNSFILVADAFYEGCTDQGQKPDRLLKFGSPQRLYGEHFGDRANGFARDVAKMPSAQYALGRLALQQSVRWRGSWAGPQRLFDPAQIKTPNPTAQLFSQELDAIWRTRAQNRIDEMELGDLDWIPSDDITKRLIRSLGLADNWSLQQTGERLREIWSSEGASDVNRILALQLWYRNGEKADKWEHSLSIATDLEELLKVALQASKEVGDTAFAVLGHLLSHEQLMVAALVFLEDLEKILKGAFRNDEGPKSDKLLKLYAGILATHGRRGPDILPTLAPRVEESALSLFDIARNHALSKEDRIPVLESAIDLAHGLLPYGAQAAYAWALWQVEKSSDPYIAFHTARTYANAFNIPDGKTFRATFSAQDEVLRAALRRRDLSHEHRESLWHRYQQNQFFWVRWWRSAQRRFGPLADPQPSVPTTEVAT